MTRDEWEWQQSYLRAAIYRCQDVIAGKRDPGTMPISLWQKQLQRFRDELAELERDDYDGE